MHQRPHPARVVLFIAAGLLTIPLATTATPAGATPPPDKGPAQDRACVVGGEDEEPQNTPNGNAYGHIQHTACPRVSGAGSARGDFNGDGFADLAVGVPREDVGSAVDAGAVNIIYGSAAGLTTAGNQFLTQDTTAIEDVAEAGDSFGAALAATDFNGDGFADLIVGVPGEDYHSLADPGMINVFRGSLTGLRGFGQTAFTQDTLLLGDPASGDRFGAALTWGRFDGDAFPDLAVGIPGETVLVGATLIAGGGVQIIRGSTSVLTSTGNQLWTQDSPGV